MMPPIIPVNRKAYITMLFSVMDNVIKVTKKSKVMSMLAKLMSASGNLIDGMKLNTRASR